MEYKSGVKDEENEDLSKDNLAKKFIHISLKNYLFACCLVIKDFAISNL